MDDRKEHVKFNNMHTNIVWPLGFSAFAIAEDEGAKIPFDIDNT